MSPVLPRSNSTSSGRNRGLHSGFTLVELMIAMAVGSVLLVGAITMLMSHIRSSARMEALMRLQETWSRVQFLLDQEIREARHENNIASSEDCLSNLTLEIPNTTNGAEDATVTYTKTEDDTLTRNGPPILDTTGELDFSADASTETVVHGVNSFCPKVIDGRITYTLSLRDATGVTYQNQSQPSGARSTSRVIDES